MIPNEIAKKFEKRQSWAGTNQTMRMIDSRNAKIVLIAEDVIPIEIILPLKKAVEDGKIEHYFGSKNEISKIVKCPRPTSAACLV